MVSPSPRVSRGRQHRLTRSRSRSSYAPPPRWRGESLLKLRVRCPHLRMQRTEGSHLPRNESPSSFGNAGSACGSLAWFFRPLLTRLQSPLPVLLVSQLSSVCTVLALPSDPQLLIPQGRAQMSPRPPPTVPILLAGLVSQIP